MPKKKLILESKLLPPRIIESSLPRERLLNLLRKNLNKELILICADAGYGKTTLLSHFCKQIPGAFIFYTLEPSDNDLATFFSYLTAGIQKKYTHFGKRTKSVVGKTQNPEILVGTLVNELMEYVKEKFYIIMDDYQFVQNNKTINKALDFFIEHMPPQIHLLIASRLTPQLNLVNYLTKQKLFKIEKEHLQFSTEEIQLLLNDIYGLQVTENDINRIREHSEGWITAIQLVLLRISTSSANRVNQTLDGYVSSGQDIFDYFAHEVFEKGLKDMQDFLIKTSFLENMTPKICDELCAMSNSVEVLKKLVQENIFISRTGEYIYRYHPLFKNYVNDVAEKRYGIKYIYNVYSEVGRIFEKQRDFDLAIDYYLRANNYKQAIICFRKISYDIMDAGGVNRIKSWLELFPDDYFNDDPWLLAMKSRVMRITHSLGAKLDLSKRAIAVAKRKKDYNNLFWAYYEAALDYSWVGNFEESLKYLKKCSRMKTAKPKDLLYVYNAEGVSYSSLGDFKKAELMHKKALNILNKYNYTEETAMVLGNIAVLAIRKGEFEKALKLLKKTIAPKDSLFSSFQYVNLAGIYINMGRFKEARQALLHAYRCSKQFANRRGYLYFLRTLGVYYCELNDFQKAKRYFRAVIRICAEVKEQFLENITKLKLMSVFHLSGDLSTARQYMKELFDPHKIKLNVRTHQSFIAKGLIELALKKYKKAEATLVKCHQLVANTNFKYNLAQSNYYLAYFYLQVKKKDKAEYYLSSALKIAKTMKYDAMLITEIDRDDALIQFAIRRSIQSGYVNALISKIIETRKVQIRCLGDLEVTIGHRQIPRKDWQTKKAQMIFTFLILNRDRPVTRDKLIDIFYRQSSPEVAKNNLRSEIWRVNKALIWDKYIIYDSGFYRVNKDLRLEIDAEKFENLVNEVLAGENKSDKVMIEKARSAVDLYQDDFLSSFRHAWCSEMREYYLKLYIDILGIVGNFSMHKGELKEAHDIFQRILVKHPFDESGHFGIIKCYLGLGNRSRAVKHYEILKERLRSELNTTPSKRIEELIKT